MSWPSPQDYNEAIQVPHLSFADPELQKGRPELTSLGLPKPMTGAFAIVFKMKCGRTNWAVRFFLREIPDIERRYEHISKFIMTDDLPQTVSFDYVPRGLRISGRWFPMLKMEWVEGEPLDQYIKRNLHNRDALVQLSQRFEQMVEQLQAAGIAHGDLQHGNILVVNGELRLVDYDGMFVPSMSGYPSHELGHRNYQHPGRSHREFGPTLDNFSSWVIHTSLLALIHDPNIWPLVNGGDECLLFKQADFQAPLRSRVFNELEHHSHEIIRSKATLLRHVLFYPPSQIPPFDPNVSHVQQLPPLPNLGKAPEFTPFVFQGNITSPDVTPQNMTGVSEWWREWQNPSQPQPVQQGNAPAQTSPQQSWQAQPGQQSSMQKGRFPNLPSPNRPSTSQADLQRAEQLCNQGLLQLERSNFAQALRYFTQSQSAEPRLAHAYFGQGLAQAGLQNYSAALEKFELATSLAPQCSAVYGAIAYCRFKLGHVRKAEPEIVKALKLNALDFFALLSSGMLRNHRGQWKEAIQELDKAIGVVPNDAEAYFVRGVSHFNLHAWKSAVDDLNNAIRLDPMPPLPYYYRGLSLAEMGHHEYAIKDFDSCINGQSSLIQAHYARAVSEFSMGKYDAAARDFHHYAVAKPDEGLGWKGLAIVYFQQRRYIDALTAFNAAVKAAPNCMKPEDLDRYTFCRAYQELEQGNTKYAEDALSKLLNSPFVDKSLVYMARASACMANEQFQSALVDLNYALSKNEDPHLLCDRGHCYNKMGKYEEASKDFGRALELYPDFPAALSGLGWTRYLMGHDDLATECFRRALVLPQPPADAYFGKAKLLIKYGRPAEAVHFLQQAVLRDPKEIEYRLELGELLNSSRRFADAIEVYNQILVKGLTSAKTYFGRALARLGMNNITGAIDDLSSALVSDPEYEDAYLLRSKAFSALKRFDRALADFDKGIHGKPATADLMVQRATLSFELGKLEETAQSCTNALALDETCIPAYYLRGQCMLANGQPQKANADFTAGSNIQTTRLRYLHYRALCHKALGDLNRAYADLSDYVEHAAQAGVPVQPQIIFEKADVSLASGLHYRALSDLNGYLQQFPNDVEALLKRAMCLRRLSKHVQAKQELEQLLAVVPKRTDVLLEHAEVCWHLNSMLAGMNSYKTALLVDPSLASTERLLPYFRNLLSDAISSGSSDDAIKCLDQILKMRPFDKDCLLKRATIFESQGKVMEALHDLDQALLCDPQMFDATLQKAKLLDRLNKDDEALVLYERAVEMVPGHQPARYRMGTILYQSGNYKAAIEHLEQCPSYKEASLLIGKCHFELGDYETTIAWCDAVHELAEDRRECLSLKASSLIALNLNKDALRTINQAFSAARDSVSDLAKPQATDADYAQMHCLRGTIHMNLKKYAPAETDFVAACSLDQTNVEAAVGLAKVCIARKEFQRAEKSLKRAVKLDPDNPVVHDAFGLLYAKMKKFDQSAAAYKKAEDLLLVAAIEEKSQPNERTTASA